jgi:pyrroloquinoline quinone biosynthesis protein B
MHVRVLGAAAGGGFPQWNANSEACRRARAGDPAARPATQASVALSRDGQRWALVNASPDLRQQIESTPALHPSGGLRSSPVKAVVLTNGDVDAVAGLLNLREGTPFALYAHPRVHAALDDNPLFNVVDRRIVPRRELEPDRAVALGDAAGDGLGLSVRPFLAPGKVPLYLEGRAERVDTAAFTGDALGLEVTPAGCEGPRVLYLANCARLDAGTLGRIAGADLLFMDGTLWSDDEMIVQGAGTKTGARMADVPLGRRVFIHVNNTNPALLKDSPQRAQLEAAGWIVAEDGMEFEL